MSVGSCVFLSSPGDHCRVAQNVLHQPGGGEGVVRIAFEFEVAAEVELLAVIRR